MSCRLCGLTEHVGGCELEAFYFYQRYGRTAPPTPLIEERGAASIGTIPLSHDSLLMHESTLADIPVYETKQDRIKRYNDNAKKKRIAGKLAVQVMKDKLVLPKISKDEQLKRAKLKRKMGLGKHV